MYILCIIHVFPLASHLRIVCSLRLKLQVREHQNVGLCLSLTTLAEVFLYRKVIHVYLKILQTRSPLLTKRSFSELKFAKEINELSERHAIQVNWRDLARKCDVSITSRFDYHKNGSISVENKVYAFTMNKCTFKRITTPPMSDQEKCMVILSLWIKGLQTTHQVTSLIPLLKRKNIEYLTGDIFCNYVHEQSFKKRKFMTT